MKLTSLISAAAVVLSIGLSASLAWATPTDYVKKRTDDVTKILSKKDSKKRQEQLKDVLQQTIDFRELASRALGQHWTARTPEEQQEFLDLLQELLQANYEGKLSGKTLGKDYEIKYADEKVRADKAIVKTVVVAKEESKPVDVKLVKKGEDWSIYDVVIDDISLEETYRDSYVEIIEKEGWTSLIQRMKDKAAEIRTADKDKKPAPAPKTK